ncbi:MAG: DUF1080 domain-containing protein [Verrucomicrobiota bacterium]
MKIPSLFLISAAVLGTATFSVADNHAASGGWTHLFNGKNLDGWVQKNGTAPYTVENGTIVGRTAVGSPNSFLCTEKEFGNFELQFEVNVQNGLNSGVQIRSQVRAKDVGKGKNDKAGRVNGPQVEIEASGEKGAESGYIYGEASYGWMVPKEDLKPHKYFKDGEWNHYRVVTRGPNIRTWINGNPVANITHEEAFKTHSKGFIGLQVHSIPKNKGPFQVAWKNIKIREFNTTAPAGKASGKGKGKGKAAAPAPASAKAADQSRPLFNGKDLDGWFLKPEEITTWRTDPKKGLLIRKAGSSYVWTKEAFGDFILDLEFNLTARCNSGVFFRTDPENPVQGGFEIQIFDSGDRDVKPTNDMGALYDALAPSEHTVKPPGEWNKMRLHAEGPKVVVHLNDQKILEANLDDWKEAGVNPDGSKNKFKTALSKLPRSGHIGLQDHGHNISFRNIRITELGKKTAGNANVDAKAALQAVLKELFGEESARVSAAEAELLEKFPQFAKSGPLPEKIDQEIATDRKALMALVGKKAPLPTLTAHLLKKQAAGELSGGEKVLLREFLQYGLKEIKAASTN